MGDLTRTLLARALEWSARLSRRPRGVALVYHGVTESGAPGVVPELGTSELDVHLRYLQARYRVVPAWDLPEAALSRRRGGRIPVAVTFDDDLRSHLELAAPLLRKRGVPATFFLTGAGLDGGGAFWWQSLQAAVDAQRDLTPVVALFGLAAEPLDALVAGIEGLAPAPRRRLASELERLAGPDPQRRALNRDEVRALATGELTIGFHTLRHDRMTALDDDELRAALDDGRSELAAAAGAPLTLIAYPHGAADGRVAVAAARAGFALGFVTRMDPVTPSEPALLLPRPEILATSAARFGLDLASIVRPLGALRYARALRARTASSSS